MLRHVNLPFRGCRNSVFEADKILDYAKVLSYVCLGFFIVYISYPVLWEDTCRPGPLLSGPRLAFINAFIMLPFIFDPLVTKMTFWTFRRECSRDQDQLKKRVLKKVQENFKIASPIKKEDWRSMVKKRSRPTTEVEERKALEIASGVVVSWLATRCVPEVQKDTKFFSFDVFGLSREEKFDRLCGYVAPFVVKPLFLGPDDGTVPCSTDPEDKAWKMAFSLGKDLLLKELERRTILIPTIRANLEEIIVFLYLRALEVASEKLYRHRQQVIEITSELLKNGNKVKNDKMYSILDPLPKRKTTWFNKVCVFQNKSRPLSCMTNLINKMVTAVRGGKVAQECDTVTPIK